VTVPKKLVCWEELVVHAVVIVPAALAVERVQLAGTTPAEIVPTAWHWKVAPRIMLVPSDPLHVKAPSESAAITAPWEPTVVPRLFAKKTFGPAGDAMNIPTPSPVVPAAPLLPRICPTGIAPPEVKVNMLVPPKMMALVQTSKPDVLIEHPAPLASAPQGAAAEPDAVVICSSRPVPVFDAVSVIVTRLTPDPVAAPNVHVEVFPAIASA
jgi:hypothetical protein